MLEGHNVPAERMAPALELAECFEQYASGKRRLIHKKPWEGALGQRIQVDVLEGEPRRQGSSNAPKTGYAG